MTQATSGGGIDLGLSGRSALVTGAGAGIGREIARWLARAGCRIAVNDIDPRALEKLARKNREESQRRYEEATKKPSIGASKKRRKVLAGSAPPDDPRYEGVNRLFTKMKKKDRK